MRPGSSTDSGVHAACVPDRTATHRPPARRDVLQACNATGRPSTSGSKPALQGITASGGRGSAASPGLGPRPRQVGRVRTRCCLDRPRHVLGRHSPTGPIRAEPHTAPWPMFHVIAGLCREHGKAFATPRRASRCPVATGCRADKGGRMCSDPWRLDRRLETDTPERACYLRPRLGASAAARRRRGRDAGRCVEERPDHLVDAVLHRRVRRGVHRTGRPFLGRTVAPPPHCREHVLLRVRRSARPEVRPGGGSGWRGRRAG